MKKTKRGVGVSFVAMGALILSVLAPMAAFASASDQCPGANEGNAPELGTSEYEVIIKVEADQDGELNDVTSDAAFVCVKGSTTATGLVPNDGSTMTQFLQEAGADNDVSYYMEYRTVETAPELNVEVTGVDECYVPGDPVAVTFTNNSTVAVTVSGELTGPGITTPMAVNLGPIGPSASKTYNENVAAVGTYSVSWSAFDDEDWPTSNTIQGSFDLVVQETCDAPEESRTRPGVAKVWIDADGEVLGSVEGGPADGVPTDGWRVDLIMDGDEEPLLTLDGVADSKQVGAPGIVVGDTYSVTETLVGETAGQWNTLSAAECQSALVREGEGESELLRESAQQNGSSDFGMVTFGPVTDFEATEGFVEHVICNQEIVDEDPTIEVFSTPDPDPVIDPAASFDAECVTVNDEGLLEVSYTLDNEASDEDVTFEVYVGETVVEVEVDAGDVVNDAIQVEADGQQLVLITDGETSLTGDGTIVDLDCAIEVLPDAEEPEPEPEPEDETEEEVEPVQVRGVSEEARAAALPDTGASALMLALLGLLSVGFGGALLRPRKRD